MHTRCRYWAILVVLLQAASAGCGDSDSERASVPPVTTSEQAVEAIQRLGGRVSGEPIDRVSFEKAGLADADLPVVARYLQLLPALDTVDLSYNRLTGQTLDGLGQLDRLSTLYLNGNPLDDASLAVIGRLTGIRNLDISDTPASDAGIQKLAANQNLVELSLQQTGITDASAAVLGTISNLAVLRLYWTNVSDASLGELRGLAHLRHLQVCGTKITLSGLTEGGGFGALQTISIYGMGETIIDDRALGSLAKLESLRELVPYESELAEHGLEETTGIVIVRALSRVNVTDAGLKALEPLKTLRILEIDSPHEFSAEAIASLRNALPSAQIKLNRKTID